MIRLVFMLEEDMYKNFVKVCEELKFQSIDECLVWALERLIRRCHTGFNSSAISSDVSNHPPYDEDNSEEK